MKPSHSVVGVGLLLAASIVVASSCQVTKSLETAAGGAKGSLHHEQRVMSSEFCGTCHPAMYAEHAQNTHGRAFTDAEVRLATGRFDHGDCIRCHTPRPIAETGLGMNPQRRHHNLEEGNTCMTCHLQQGYDYSTFEGGAECVDAFDDRVGTVQACASCHRNHGTPYQWEVAPTGKESGQTCMTCHMQRVLRPVATGEEPRRVRSHVFPGSRSEKQLRRAYRYEAEIDGNEVVVKVTNKGAGHNFPTELKQRSVESLVVVRDAEGNEVSRSRMVFRDPYKRPYGLNLPVNTQIAGGETREHRVPIKVADGRVETELHYKLYFPIEDHHPDLSRQLESRVMTFADVDPSTAEVDPDPTIAVVVPEAIPAEAASPANLVDFARPPIGTVEIELPEGDSPEAIAELISMFQFPVPAGNKLAQDRLAEIGSPAIPALIEGLASWDNKTWKQSMKVLRRIGTPAESAVIDAMTSDQLYARIHARQLAESMEFADRRALIDALRKGLTSDHPLDRSGAAKTLSLLGADVADQLRELLEDRDPDVVRAAALGLARLDDAGAARQVVAAMHRAYHDETRRDVAEAAALLGDPEGVPILLAGLDHRDDLIRESFFESLFAVTGLHFGYDPLMPRPERLEAIGNLQAHWAAKGGADQLRRPHRPSEAVQNHAWNLVSKLGGGAGIVPGGDDAAIKQQLVNMGADAVPALVLGLKFPPGFAGKRAQICECLGTIGSGDAAPALASTLRDPVIAVAAWACWALERVGDPATAPAVERYHARLLSTAASTGIPESAGPVDLLSAQAARTRLLLGDRAAAQTLITLLSSDIADARRTAISALEITFGETKGYDPDASADERREAASRWNQ